MKLKQLSKEAQKTQEQMVERVAAKVHEDWLAQQLKRPAKPSDKSCTSKSENQCDEPPTGACERNEGTAQTHNDVIDKESIARIVEKHLREKTRMKPCDEQPYASVRTTTKESAAVSAELLKSSQVKPHISPPFVQRVSTSVDPSNIEKGDTLAKIVCNATAATKAKVDKSTVKSRSDDMSPKGRVEWRDAAAADVCVQIRCCFGMIFVHLTFFCCF